MSASRVASAWAAIAVASADSSSVRFSWIWRFWSRLTSASRRSRLVSAAARLDLMTSSWLPSLLRSSISFSYSSLNCGRGVTIWVTITP
ncbi:hypothetical protein [Nannocystis pusilla]|uniref:hypothetical protein n=1 Tax=Nannocystis pusilla TaxID=889268 RepID=UPI003B807D37